MNSICVHQQKKEMSYHIIVRVQGTSVYNSFIYKDINPYRGIAKQLFFKVDKANEHYNHSILISNRKPLCDSKPTLHSAENCNEPRNSTKIEKPDQGLYLTTNVKAVLYNASNCNNLRMIDHALKAINMYVHVAQYHVSLTNLKNQQNNFNISSLYISTHS